MFVNCFLTTFAVSRNDSDNVKIVIMLAFFIICFIFPLIKLYTNKIKLNKFISTEGEITYIEKYSYHSGGRRYTNPPANIPTDNGYRVKYGFRVGYTYYDSNYHQYNGEFKVDQGFSGMLAGQRIKVYFNPNNPSDSIVENDIKAQEKRAVGSFLAVLALIAVFAVLMYIKVK